MSKRKRLTWGDIFYGCLAKGWDHGYAAYAADKWEAATPIPRSTGPHPDPLAEAPIAEDWENACHEMIWKKDPELFARIQEQAVLERQERLAKAASSFPQPAWNPGGKPCGECHLRDGETCDICGAVEPLDPDRLREDRNERNRLERENPYAE